MRIGVFGNQDSWYVHELCRVGTARGHVMLPLLHGASLKMDHVDVIMP